MASRVRSRKAHQLEHSRRLRAAGSTWAEIANAFRQAYGMNARVAARTARNWSQAEAAEQWNRHWPDDPRTFKNFSYWEQWPASTGYAPSLEVLTRLAELYQCRMSDLLEDGPDYSDDDEMRLMRQNIDLVELAVSGVPAGHGELPELVSRVQEADVRELAETLSVWGHQMDSAIDRRSLLLKLSFAMTMAAAAPETAGPSTDHRSAEDAGDLSGVWRSKYMYRSSGRDEQFEDVHYVVIRQDGRQLAVESLPHPTGSELSLALQVDSYSATGTWEERTSPTGYYKGAMYRGAIQLLVSPTGAQMTGKWLGFGKNFAINSGDWELTLEDRSTTKAVLRSYSMKS